MNVLINKGDYALTLHLKEGQVISIDMETYTVSEGVLYLRIQHSGYNDSYFVMESGAWKHAERSVRKHFPFLPGLSIETK